ncbi:MAG: hypothetical protein ACRDMJ_12955 [Solirubrobacteraceae bacterium]
MTTNPEAEPEQRSFYLGAEGSFVTFHGVAAPSTTGVVICPPFGWEEVSSYRPRRAWAQSLAGAGRPTLRLTLPSTGDSGGAVDDPNRLDAWTDAVGAAAAWLKHEVGVSRVVAIGMQLGAMLAYRSASLGSEVDDLALWACPSRGRALLRQFRAFSKIELEQFFANLTPPPPLPDGEIEAAGFRLSAQSVREIEQLDLTTLALPEAGRRRVLLLERDGLAVDAALHRHLIEGDAAVTTGVGEGYADTTSHPQTATAPEATFTVVAAWLDEANPASERGLREGNAAMQVAASRTRLRAGKAQAWTETPLLIEQIDRALPAVLTEPAKRAPGDLCAVWLDTGAVRRIGPSRMWTEAARRWAQRGVSSLRLDIDGIGDAGGPVVAYPDDALFHSEHLVRQVLTALDALQARGIGRRFVLVGLCSGAYWAFHACLADARVCSVAMLNCRVLAWKAELAPARYARTLLSERPSLGRIRRVASRALVLEVLRWIPGAIWRRLSGLIRAPRNRRTAVDRTSEEARLIERLLGSQRRALLLFSEREPLFDELVRSGDMDRLQRSAAITIRRLPVDDHTLRPVWAQRRAHEALDEALGRELALAAIEDGDGDAISLPAGPA